MEYEFSEFSEFTKSDKSLKLKIGQFKDPVSQMCLAGIVLAFRFITGIMFNPFTVRTNILVTEFSEFNENIYRENSSVSDCIFIIHQQWGLQQQVMVFILNLSNN